MNVATPADVEALKSPVEQALAEGNSATTYLRLQQALSKADEDFGADALQTHLIHVALAELLLQHNKTTLAEPLFRSALAGLRRQLGDHDPNILSALRGLKDIYLSEGRLGEASEILRDEIDVSANDPEVGELRVGALLEQSGDRRVDAGELPQARLVDMCCGSGNLACGIATNRPDLRVWACDLTEQAARIARANVGRLGLGVRVEVLHSDLFAGLDAMSLRRTIDMVVCNPPYISSGKLERERADLLAHEPREAFDGGPYGMHVFQRVIRDAVDFLKPGGTLLLEIGVGQERQVSRLFDRTGCYEPVAVIADREDRPRVVAGTTRG